MSGKLTVNNRTNDEQDVRALYHALISAWNERNARAYAAVCEPTCNLIGFDGSAHDGSAQIENDMARIFESHPTAAYVYKVREVRFLSEDVAMLRAVVGMVPPGKTDLNPAANAVQSLVAVKRDDRWLVSLFHNTPAAYHGRPELAEQLTEELRAVLREQ